MIRSNGTDESFPRELDGHVLEEELPRGLRGQRTFRAQRTGRPLALRIFDESLAVDRQVIETFHRERGDRLRHPNLQSIEAVGEVDSCIYYSTKYLRGDSLSTTLTDLRAQDASRPSLSPLALNHDGSRQSDFRQAAAKLLAEVAEGLHLAHERGLFHLALGPRSLVFSVAGRLVITDFDGASTPSAHDDIEILPYRAPELLDAGSSNEGDARSDVYSLGALLYEIITLQTPCADRDIDALRSKICSGTWKAAKQIDPGIPSTLDHVLSRALSTAPENRHASAAEFAADLRAVLRGDLPASFEFEKAPANSPTGAPDEVPALQSEISRLRAEAASHEAKARRVDALEAEIAALQARPQLDESGFSEESGSTAENPANEPASSDETAALLSQAEEKRAQLQAEYDELLQELQDSDDAKAVAAAENSSLRDEFEALTGQVAALQSQSDTLRGQLDARNEEFDALRAEIAVSESGELDAEGSSVAGDALLAEISDLRAELSFVQQERTGLLAELQDLRTAQSQTPEPENESESKAEIDELTSELQLAEKNKADALQQVEELHSEVDELRSNLEAAEIAKLENEDLQSDLSRASSEASRLRSKLNRVEQDRKALEDELGGSSKTAEIAKLENEELQLNLSRATSEASRLRSKLNRVEQDRKALEIEKSRIEESKQSVAASLGKRTLWLGSAAVALLGVSLIVAMVVLSSRGERLETAASAISLIEQGKYQQASQASDILFESEPETSKKIEELARKLERTEKSSSRFFDALVALSKQDGKSAIASLDAAPIAVKVDDQFTSLKKRVSDEMQRDRLREQLEDASADVRLTGLSTLTTKLESNQADTDALTRTRALVHDPSATVRSRARELLTKSEGRLAFASFRDDAGVWSTPAGELTELHQFIPNRDSVEHRTWLASWSKDAVLQVADGAASAELRPDLRVVGGDTESRRQLGRIWIDSLADHEPETFLELSDRLLASKGLGSDALDALPGVIAKLELDAEEQATIARSVAAMASVNLYQNFESTVRCLAKLGADGALRQLVETDHPMSARRLALQQFASLESDLEKNESRSSFLLEVLESFPEAELRNEAKRLIDGDSFQGDRRTSQLMRRLLLDPSSRARAIGWAEDFETRERASLALDLLDHADEELRSTAQRWIGEASSELPLSELLIELSSDSRIRRRAAWDALQKNQHLTAANQSLHQIGRAGAVAAKAWTAGAETSISAVTAAPSQIGSMLPQAGRAASRLWDWQSERLQDMTQALTESLLENLSPNRAPELPAPEDR